MKLRFKHIAMLLILATTLTLVSCDNGDTTNGNTKELVEINVGLISTESSMALRKLWDPVIADMEKALGMKVKPHFASDYAGIVEAMRFGKVQVGWFGNKSAIEAVDRSEGEVFAQEVPAEGPVGYYSVLIVKDDSPIQTLEDVLSKGKELTFGNGDPNSTSGNLVPGYYVFAKNKIDPKSHFKQMRTSNHEANLIAVATGQVDIATNNTENIERFTLTNAELAKKVRVVWKSPLIPSDPLVWRKDLPDDLKKKIRSFFIDYGKTPEEKANLNGLGNKGFRESSNSQLVPVRQLEVFKERVRIESDTTLNAEAKKEKLAKLDEQLAQLEKEAPTGE